jgi:hypothetical protein
VQVRLLPDCILTSAARSTLTMPCRAVLEAAAGTTGLVKTHSTWTMGAVVAKVRSRSHRSGMGRNATSMSTLHVAMLHFRFEAPKSTNSPSAHVPTNLC